MIKIISSADWHLQLHKKKVPYAWQLNRFKLLFEKLHALERDCDVHVIAGDLFDKKPEPDEICLLLSYLNSVTIPTIIIPGNHEATRKGSSFWEHFLIENTVKNELVHIFTQNDRIQIAGVWFCLFPYGSVQTNTLPPYIPGDILVTHIRGEVPPHITEEYDFSKLTPWPLVLLGDLHFNHRYKNTTAYYPGSPLNTSFDRDDKRQYGVDIFTWDGPNNYSKHFVDLQLPKLIRKTIEAGEQMLPDAYNHIIYEVTGSLDALSQIENHELLDKKMVEKPSASSALDLKNLSTHQELEAYLSYIKVADIDAILKEFSSLGIQQ